MTDFENRTPNPGKLINSSDQVIDLQQLAESGAITVTATMAPAVVTPIGDATVPKYVNMTPIAGKFINVSDEVIDLVDFMTSGDIKMQVIGGGGGGAPTTSTYITQTDETIALPNSISMNALATGFMTSTNTVGIAVSRTLSGTANQVSVANGDGSANPTFSLPATLIAPGTLQATTSLNIGGAGATVTTISIDGTLVSNSDTKIVTEQAVKTYVDAQSGGGFPNATYITQNDETVNLPNSIPMDALATGFMTSTNAVGIATSRSLTGTANEVNVANGDGSGNPAFSLSSTLIFPGTSTLGGDMDVLDHAITTSHISGAVGIIAATTVDLNAPWTSVQSIRRLGESTNKIIMGVSLQQFLPDNTLEFQVNGSGITLSAGATVNEISADGTLAADSDALLSTQRAIKSYVDSATSALIDISYITQQNETGELINSIPLNALETGFMTSINAQGLGDSRTLTGTANEVNISVGDGSADPVFSLSSTIITPGTFNIGGGGATVNTISIDTSLSGGNATTSSTGAVKAYVDSRSLSVVNFTGTSTTMVSNTRYIVDNVALVTLTLPAVMSLGDNIEIWGKSAGLYRIAQQAGQTMHVGTATTTTGAGGSLTATQQYDFLRICCITDNVQFSSVPRGSFTAV